MARLLFLFGGSLAAIPQQTHVLSSILNSLNVKKIHSRRFHPLVSWFLEAVLARFPGGVALELGSFVGYTALRLGRALAQSVPGVPFRGAG